MQLERNLTRVEQSFMRVMLLQLVSGKEFSIYTGIIINEPRHEKTNILHMQKQRRRSASR